MVSAQYTGGRRSHSSPLVLSAVLIVSLFVILMVIPSFISFTSQIFTPLVEIMKTKHGLRLVLLVVSVSVFVFLTSNNNNNKNENTSSYNSNDEHEWISSIFSSYPDDDDLLYHYYQQREDRVQEERGESNLQPKTPPPLSPLRPPVFDGAKEHKDHKQKNVHTILNPQKPSSTAAQKPPLPDKEVRSNRVDQHVSSGTTSPLPQAGARRKPLSPLKRSSWSSSEDEKASSSSDSSSFIPFPQSPPPPPFKIRPQKYTLYVRIQSDNSSSCDSPDPMSSSLDVNVKAERFIGKFNADLEKQGRGRSNLARPRSLKTRRKKEGHV